MAFRTRLGNVARFTARGTLTFQKRTVTFVDLRKFVLTADFTRLNLATADLICDEAIKECQKRGYAPITIVVVDPAGRLIVKKRMDHCPNGPAAFADAKVSTLHGREKL
jgi:hypothetical protein